MLIFFPSEKCIHTLNHFFLITILEIHTKNNSYWKYFVLRNYIY